MFDIYWNSHRKMFSVRHKGRVVKHAHSVNAFDAVFVVQPAGQSKVRATGQKNIHAFVRCRGVEYLEPGAPPLMFRKHRVRYDPYVNDSFVIAATGEEVIAAESVSLRIRNTYPEILV